MDVDQPVPPTFDETVRQEPHEAGEAHKIDAALAQGIVQGGVERFPIGKIPVTNHRRRDPRRFGPLQAGRTGSVRSTRNDLGWKAGSGQGASTGLRFGAGPRHPYSALQLTGHAPKRQKNGTKDGGGKRWYGG